MNVMNDNVSSIQTEDVDTSSFVKKKVNEFFLNFNLYYNILIIDFISKMTIFLLFQY